MVAAKSDGGWQHQLTKDHADLASKLVAWNTKGEIYFALASFAQGFHSDPTGKRVLRVRTNVAALKALWFDIDFKGSYADAHTAILALKKFCAATQIPLPALWVLSGNGLHVYWPLSEAIELDDWQPLANALKAAALQHQLGADTGCTADACRVLRPIGTHNRKDPANPKPVRLIHSSEQTFDYTELEAALKPWMTVPTAPVKPNGHDYSELTGGLAWTGPEASFEIVKQHCGVAKMLADTHGEKATEPLWKDSLQLLKFCSDKDIWVHSLSDGHPGYSVDATNKKWQQRLDNTARPTLCSTFATHEPTICKACPHNGHISTPLEVGHADVQSLDGLPAGYRIAANHKGIERLVSTEGGKEWKPVLRYVPTNLRASRSIVTKQYEVTFDITTGRSASWDITLPGGTLGNVARLKEVMGSYGYVLQSKEAGELQNFMGSWLEKLQDARRVADTTEQLGWLTEKDATGERIVGFSHGKVSYYADGRVNNDVHAAREFDQLAKLYEPRGGLDQWKSVAAFLADQNKSALTAILAAAFAAPLLKFTGVSGAILSLVSTASGAGKTSALKCSQAVWGSPTQGVNAVDDTHKSVAKKLGFLNNLPSYWDELRGRKTVDDFLTLAFQISQGKERTRLDSSAQIREVATWETMLIVASNESIFEAMSRFGGGSDAGMMRVFEILIEPFKTNFNNAKLQVMFGTLNENYGQAGRLYAQYLATNAPAVALRVRQKYETLATALTMQPQERFWFAIMAVLIVGAENAATLDLVKINIRDMTRFLLANVMRLRSRSVKSMALSEPAEILAGFMSDQQDRMLMVDHFPRARATTASYQPITKGLGPRSGKMAFHVSEEEELLRVSCATFERWLQARNLPVYNIMKQFRAAGAREIRTVLGIGTSYNLPPTRCLEINLKAFGLSVPVLPNGPALAVSGVAPV